MMNGSELRGGVKERGQKKGSKRGEGSKKVGRDGKHGVELKRALVR